jgi:hypothetical protein
MKRFDCMSVLAKLLKDELVILSLGASVDEWYNAAPHMREASLFQQQLGCVTPQAFGLAAGLPHRQIVSLDTDGGMMFNLGILATLANEQPRNLFVVVWDNQCYQSIGGPPTHTAGRVDIAAIARGAGIEHAYTVRDLNEFAAHCEAGLRANSLRSSPRSMPMCGATSAASIPTGARTNTFSSATSKPPRASSSWARASTTDPGRLSASLRRHPPSGVRPARPQR